MREPWFEMTTAGVDLVWLDTCNEPPEGLGVYLSVLELGSDGYRKPSGTTLTPAQARALAAELLRRADAIDGGEKR